MGNYFSLDVEDWFQVENLSGVISRSDWDRKELRVERNMDELLELFDASGTKVTCFMLGYIARKRPELVKRIAGAGHEIASHGEDHESITSKTKQSFKTSVEDLKHYLEDLTGKKVTGYRAPNFTIVERTWWAFDVLAECGYQYDSSVFPFKRRRYGIQGAPQTPYMAVTTSGAELLEIPPSVLQIGGRSIPIAGGGYFRLYPYMMTKAAIKYLNRQSRDYFFYLHPWEIDHGQPRVKGLPAKNRAMHYLNLKRTGKRISKLLHDFHFEPYGSFCDQFQEGVAQRFNLGQR